MTCQALQQDALRHTTARQRSTLPSQYTPFILSSTHAVADQAPSSPLEPASLAHNPLCWTLGERHHQKCWLDREAVT